MKPAFVKKGEPSALASIRARLMQKAADIKAKQRRFWKPSAGDNLIRILPWRADEPFYYESKQHFIPWGGRQGKGVTVACLEGTGRSCYCCAEAEKLIDMGSKEAQELGKQLQVSSRYFYCIVDLKHPEEGVQIWSSYSENVLADLISEYANGEVGDFTDPDSGYNITLHKKEKAGGAFPEYDVKIGRKPTRIVNREWLKKAKDLRKLTTAPDYQQMKDLMMNSPFAEHAESDDEDPALSLPCFGKEYLRLPTCGKCPVKKRCKKVYRARRAERRSRKVEQIKAGGMLKMKQKVGAA